MKAPAIIASVTIACSLGFAAGQGRPAMTSQDMATPPITPKDSMTRDGAGDQGGVAMQSTVASCEGAVITGDPEQWFTVLHRMPECNSRLWGSSSITNQPAVDVDGDGIPDRLVPMRRLPEADGEQYIPTDWMGNWYSSNAGQCCVGTWVLFRAEFSHSDGATSTSFKPVLSSWFVNELLACALPRCCSDGNWCANHKLYLAALEDMDKDGDLDLIIRVEALFVDISAPPYSPLPTVVAHAWLENTAVANPPLTGDINGDGAIDGKDLAYVLSAWTP